MGNHDVLQRHAPNCARLFSEIIFVWPSVEIQMRTILLKLLDGSARPVNAMYSALTTFRTRKAMIETAAETLLGEDELRLLKALLSFADRSGRVRDILAHRLMGVCPDIEESLLLIDPASHSDYIVSEIEFSIAMDAHSKEYSSSHLELMEKTRGMGSDDTIEALRKGLPKRPDPPDYPLEGIFVYSQKELEAVKAAILAAASNLNQFNRLRRLKRWPSDDPPGQSPYERQFHQLASQPEIAEILARQQKNHQKSS